MPTFRFVRMYEPRLSLMEFLESSMLKLALDVLYLCAANLAKRLLCIAAQKSRRCSASRD